jgi:hypothetical protein
LITRHINGINCVLRRSAWRSKTEVLMKSLRKSGVAIGLVYTICACIAIGAGLGFGISEYFPTPWIKSSWTLDYTRFDLPDLDGDPNAVAIMILLGIPLIDLYGNNSPHQFLPHLQ